MPSAADQASVQAEYQQLKDLRKRCGTLAFLFGLPGAMLFAVPGALAGALEQQVDAMDHTLQVLAVGAPILGFVLLGIGVAFGAKYRGHSAWWGLLALLSCPGILLLVLLKDRYAERLIMLKAQLKLLGHPV